MLFNIAIEVLYGPLARRRIYNHLTRRQDNGVFQGSHGTLIDGMKQADRFQLITKELQSQRPFVKGGIQVEHTAASAQISVLLHQGHTVIATFRQLATELIQVDALTDNTVVHRLHKHLLRQQTFHQCQR